MSIFAIIARIPMLFVYNVGPTTNPVRAVAVGLSTAAAIVGIAPALAGLAAPIVAPVAASALVAKWVYDARQLFGAVLQRFVAHISPHAAALAREGFEVSLLEAAKFPRYHIGESLLASIHPFLAFIGAEEAVVDYGFKIRVRAVFNASKYIRRSPPSSYSLMAQDPNNWSWSAIRPEFDDLLLRHASKCGATAIEETRVTEIQFEDEGNSKPVSATWRNTGAVMEGRIPFNYLVDASGKNGIAYAKSLNNRCFNPALDNVACWVYWDAEHTYKPGTRREHVI
ncbi:hypothetical protein DEU56DRAFT_918770 [Suillus clintonianus]|uniref:uncharacterized protein n=1 Tax=Suillus clintonianus TaxID=1904413 RepID=UPI001B8622BF|nr:uncharacterized protein DEU56DRAFT_918770 [Suillus clintonianus]KAG2118610.1 hypothetical protein DEU56DRAFT_918770 [Suillus clintonianus]